MSYRPPTKAIHDYDVKIVGPKCCWRLPYKTNSTGYVVLTRNKRSVAGHRFFYEWFFGAVPVGLQLDHTCHDISCAAGDACPHRACVNPFHLAAVTPKVNTRRSFRCVRHERCKRGHLWTETERLRPGGHRVCRICQTLHQRAYSARVAARGG